MSATVVIDLGEDWSLADDPPAGRPGRPRSRGLVAALLVVAVLLLATASVPIRSSFVRLAFIATQGVTASEVGDGAIFVALQNSGRRTVSRYPLGGGSQDWTVNVPGPPEYLLYLAGPRVLMVESFDVEGNGARFTMLDAATGRQLWASSGQLMLDGAASDPGALLMHFEDSGSGAATYTDLRTGKPVWSRPVREGSQLVPTDAGTRPDASGFVLAEADGTVSVLARRTGATLGSARLGRFAPDDPALFDPDQRSIVTVLGDRLIVLREIGRLQTTLDSYVLPGLRHEWSRTGDPSGFPGSCGPVLCLGEPAGLLGLDPVTGSTRWHSPGWQWAEDLGGGRLLGYRQGSGEQVGILDAGTGRVLRDLGDWAPVQGGDRPLLFTAPDRGSYRYTWFAALDLDRPGIRVLARLVDVGSRGCDPHGDLLVCRTIDGRMQVWRYRP